MKILLEIYVPALGNTIEILVSLDLPVYQVLQLIKKLLVKLTEDRLNLSNDILLCYRENGKILDINHFVYELGLKNGSKLMII
ncbi:MAG: methyltransferase [Lachnospiraceae bacterium]